ncbi:MAG: hypothetical protein QNJ31_07990 [Candidatus Caenarcaniphilales bacterium]|nr:hypothetical protein [Candidatus Caenarcaniphilales bacterium]
MSHRNGGNFFEHMLGGLGAGLLSYFTSRSQGHYHHGYVPNDFDNGYYEPNGFTWVNNGFNNGNGFHNAFNGFNNGNGYYYNGNGISPFNTNTPQMVLIDGRGGVNNVSVIPVNSNNGLINNSNRTFIPNNGFFTNSNNGNSNGQPITIGVAGLRDGDEMTVTISNNGLNGNGPYNNVHYHGNHPHNTYNNGNLYPSNGLVLMAV